jgi:hypothetical protein
MQKLRTGAQHITITWSVAVTSVHLLPLLPPKLVGSLLDVKLLCSVDCHLPDVPLPHMQPTALFSHPTQVDSGTWSAPDILPGPNPGPRAFHSAVSWDGVMLLFGGHILTFDADQNRKRRNFFNDVWLLDLVS